VTDVYGVGLVVAAFLIGYRPPEPVRAYRRSLRLCPAISADSDGIRATRKYPVCWDQIGVRVFFYRSFYWVPRIGA